MPYSVSKRLKAGTKEIEFIVVNIDGVIAPPPYGGPFALEVDAIAAREYLKKLTIEEWFAVHSGNQLSDHSEGSGKVYHIAPDGRWIQHRGYGNFGVLPPTDHELEIGEKVRVSQSGEIKLVDRGQRPVLGR